MLAWRGPPGRRSGGGVRLADRGDDTAKVGREELSLSCRALHAGPLAAAMTRLNRCTA